jgi:hypothetical protein
MLAPPEERQVDEDVLRKLICVDPQQLRTGAAHVERISAEAAGNYSQFFVQFLISNRYVHW